MEKKLKVGDVVYLTTYRNPLESIKGVILYDFGIDELDDDERELFKVLGDDKKEYVYHYPSLPNDYFYMYTRDEYISKLKSIKKENDKELARQIALTDKKNKELDNVIDSIKLNCTSYSGHDYSNWRHIKNDDSEFVTLTRKCRICRNVQKTLVPISELNKKAR